MKSTCPPPQVIFVGLESNQHGQAASHEQASSSCPVIFHGILPSVFSNARLVETVKRRLPASIGTSAMNNRVVLIGEVYVRDSSRQANSGSPLTTPCRNLCAPDIREST